MERRDLFINDLYAVDNRYYGRRKRTVTLASFPDRGDLDCYRLLSFEQPKDWRDKIDGQYRGKVKAVRCDKNTHEATGGETWIRLSGIIAPWADFVEFSEPAVSDESRIIAEANNAIAQVDKQTTEDARALVGRLTRLVFPDLGDRYKDPAERNAARSYNDDASVTSDLTANLDLKGYELAALLHLVADFDLSFPDEVAEQRRIRTEAEEVIKDRKAQRRAHLLAEDAAWEAFVEAGREAAHEAGKRYREPKRPPRAPYIYAAPDTTGPPITAL